MGLGEIRMSDFIINMIAEIADAFISFWRTMLLIRLADDCNFIRAGTDQVNEYVSKGL